MSWSELSRSTWAAASEGAYGGQVKFKLFLVMAALAGGVLVLMRRQNQLATAEAELWSEATDSVPSAF